MTKTCQCGCGQHVTPDARNRPRSFIHGHGHRGRKHGHEWLAAQSAGLRAAWQDPEKMQANRNPSPELVARRTAGLRRYKRTLEDIQKVAAALRGRKLPPEHRAKAIQALRNRPPLTQEAEQRRRRSIASARTGTHGHGRAARDNPHHCKARHWIVRDPLGAVHEFDNLASWARANEWRFLPDEFPDSKLPLWRRGVSGFNNMQRTDRKGSHAWRGWTLVANIERQTQGAPDILGRDA